MNKFLSRDHPCFDIGSVWVPCDGSARETVIRRIEKFGDNQWDYEVYHSSGSDDREYHKDIWNFQVRYMPKIFSN